MALSRKASFVDVLFTMIDFEGKKNLQHKMSRMPLVKEMLEDWKSEKGFLN